MPSPGVSVVIATRDRLDLLQCAIGAVVSQDYSGPIEVLVVFDRSTPVPTLERDDPHRRVRVLENTRSAGLPGARNSGILAAEHDLVAFCDDDDHWLANKLRRQVDALESRSAAAAVTGIQIRFEESVTPRPIDRDSISFDDLIRDRLTEAHPSTFLIRHEVFEDESELVDEEIPGGYGEDYDLLLRLARRAPIAVVPEPLVEVLWHQGSFFTRRFETIVTALDYLLDKHPEFADDRRGHARITGQQAFALAAIGRRSDSVSTALATLRRQPSEKRALLSLLVNMRVVGPETVLRLAHRTGRGI